MFLINKTQVLGSIADNNKDNTHVLKWVRVSAYCDYDYMNYVIQTTLSIVRVRDDISNGQKNQIKEMERELGQKK